MRSCGKHLMAESLLHEAENIAGLALARLQDLVSSKGYSRRLHTFNRSGGIIEWTRLRQSQLVTKKPQPVDTSQHQAGHRSEEVAAAVRGWQRGRQYFVFFPAGDNVEGMHADTLSNMNDCDAQ